MILLAIALVILLAMALVVAVARDPGPTSTDVAIGFARASGSGDFDALYRLIDPDRLKGRNRPAWITAQRVRPRLAFPPETVQVVATVAGQDTARVELEVDTHRRITVELVRRAGAWTVATYDGVDQAVGRRS